MKTENANEAVDPKGEMVLDFINQHWKPVVKNFNLTKGLINGLNLRTGKLTEMIMDDEVTELDIQEEIDELKETLKRVSIFKDPQLKKEVFTTRQ